MEKNLPNYSILGNKGDVGLISMQNPGHMNSPPLEGK